jgi:hypothetical protein
MVVPHLTTRRKQVNAIKRRVKRSKNQALKEIYLARFIALKPDCRVQLIQAKQKAWRDYCEESSRKTPWKIYKACKTSFAKTQIPSSLTLQDGTATTSVKETAEALLHKFFPDDTSVGNQCSKDTTREETKVVGPSDSLPEPDFTEQEVDEAVRSLNVNKCPGSDGIDENIVKKLHKYLPRFWLDLCNRCYALGCFPTVRKV